MSRNRQKKREQKEAKALMPSRSVVQTRGSYVWAMSYLKENMLTALLNDIYAMRKSGLEEELCEIIREFLQYYVNAALSIPESDWLERRKYSLSDLAQRFATDYSNWNKIDGSDDDAIEKRRKYYIRLQKLRVKLAEADRNLRKEISDGQNQSSIEEGYRAVKRVTSEAPPERFKNLSSALNGYINSGGNI